LSALDDEIKSEGGHRFEAFTNMGPTVNRVKKWLKGFMP
jgi:hypothetical protein